MSMDIYLFFERVRKLSNHSGNSKKAYRIFFRFSTGMDIATACIAESSCFARTSPIPHFRFARLNLRSTFHTPAFIQVILYLVSLFTLSGSSQRRIGQTDTMLFSVSEILPIPINLIFQNLDEVVSLTLAKLKIC